MLDEIDRLAAAKEPRPGTVPRETAEPADRHDRHSFISAAPNLVSPLPESHEPRAVPPPHRRPARRGLGVLGAFITGLVAAVIVLAVALLSLPYWPEEARALWRGPSPSRQRACAGRARDRVAAQVDAAKRELSARLDDLDKRVRAVANTAPQADPGTDTAAHVGSRAIADAERPKSRIEALENKPPPPAAEPSAPNSAESTRSPRRRLRCA